MIDGASGTRASSATAGASHDASAPSSTADAAHSGTLSEPTTAERLASSPTTADSLAQAQQPAERAAAAASNDQPSADGHSPVAQGLQAAGKGYKAVKTGLQTATGVQLGVSVLNARAAHQLLAAAPDKPHLQAQAQEARAAAAQAEAKLAKPFVGTDKAVEQAASKWGVTAEQATPKAGLVERAAAGVDSLVTKAAGKLPALSKLPSAAETVAKLPMLNKVLGPATVALGTYEAGAAVMDTKAPTDQRIARVVEGTSTAVSGLAVTGMALGAVAASPVMVGVAVGAGAVALGAYAYQHREQIAHGLSVAADATRQAVSSVADTVRSAWGRVFG